MEVKYRLYIDEVGNPDMGASADLNHRYLSLTGVVFDLSYVDQNLFPELEGLKRKYFEAHADEPVVLHRKELVNQKPPFEALKDPATEAAFNADFLDLVQIADLVAHPSFRATLARREGREPAANFEGRSLPPPEIWIGAS